MNTIYLWISLILSIAFVLKIIYDVKVGARHNKLKIFFTFLILVSINATVFLKFKTSTHPLIISKVETNKFVRAPMRTDIGGVRFTFDDGPHLVRTTKVLDTLKKHNLQATFFVEGINIDGKSEQAKERREILKRIYAEGHIIGNHTYNHKNICRLSPKEAAWEIDYTNKLITSTTGMTEVEYMRPPYGKRCRLLTTLLNDRKMIPIMWDIDPREWERDRKTHQFKNADQVIANIMAQYHQLHDVEGIKHMTIILHDTKVVTTELLPRLLEMLEKQK